MSNIPQEYRLTRQEIWANYHLDYLITSKELDFIELIIPDILAKALPLIEKKAREEIWEAIKSQYWLTSKNTEIGDKG